MTREEAVARIKDHIEIHRYHERNAVKISEALDMAIKALEQPEPCEDAVSRLDAIGHFRDIIEATDPKERYNEGFVDGLEFCISHLSTMPSVMPKAEQRWIPVTLETLPNPNSVVVVCGKKGTWDYGTYRGWYGDIHSWQWKKNTIKHVYWWMYKDDALPEPYREEGDE